MSRFVNPFTDLGFKVIFGQPASKGLLITLLNELLAGEHHIEDLCFLDKEDHADNVHDKGIIYDLYCRTDSGEYIIVEMQNRWHSHFLDRTLYYVCRAVGRLTELPPPDTIKIPVEKDTDGMVCESSVPYGSRYRLSTVYGIFLMNFKEDGLDKKFRTDIVLADRDTGRVVNPHLRQIYLQFPYFNKELAECETLYEKLMYALKNMNDWNRMPDALKEQVFKYLDQLAAVANLSEENRIAYDKAVDRYRVSRIVEEDIRREATEEGREEGMKKGREEERLSNALKMKRRREVVNLNKRECAKTKPAYPASAVEAGVACPKTQSKPFSGEQTSLLRTKRQHYPRFDTTPTLIKKVDQSCRKETCIANCSCSILSYCNAKSVFFVNCLPIPHIKFIPLHF